MDTQNTQHKTTVPVADRIKHVVKFGDVNDPQRGQNLMNPPREMEDYYNWMRDDSRTSTKVIAHLNNENDYTEKMMKSYDNLKNELYEELKSHIQETYDSYPFPHGKGDWNSEFYYFVRTVEGKSYPIHCRINRKTNQEEILLDENELSKGKETFDLSGFEITDDHKFMSYGVDETGNEKYQLKIINIETKQEQEHTIPELTYCSYFWHENDKYIFYTLGDSTNRMYQVWKYDYAKKEHTKLYQNDNELVNVGISQSEDEQYFFISADSFDTSDIYYFTANDNTVKQFTSKVKGMLYGVDYHEGTFFIVTNKDNSNNFKIMKTSVESTSVDNWQDFIPYDESKFMKGIVALKNYILILYKENGDSYINVINYRDGAYNIVDSFNVEIEDEIKNISYIGMGIYNTERIIYSHNSLNTPSTLYEYNLETKETKLLRQSPVPNYDKTLYETKRIYATSHDNVQVPISLVYKKDLFKNDGTNPLYLYGYGSYGHTVNPNFAKGELPLIDRGFVYAIAHVRGGSFLGYKWYEDGKMLNKMNTFRDFIACAEHLINTNYTNDKGITIDGRSAGGLLVGASMVMRPELFRTVVAGVPFVDVLNTMCDPTIPLTTPEWEQWGNPNQEEYFEYMKQYSPYDNIEDTKYPNVLALGGLNDPRVQFWEPAKFVAKLRHHNKSDNLILLKTEMHEGHFGGMDRYKYLKESAFQHAFVLKTYGL
jgi:oligopeptidase B